MHSTNTSKMDYGLSRHLFIGMRDIHFNKASAKLKYINGFYFYQIRNVVSFRQIANYPRKHKHTWCFTHGPDVSVSTEVNES